MMKLTLKLLILMAIVAAVAGLCGGWKWDAKPSTRKAAEYAVAPADPNGPALSASTDTSLTLAPADQNESDSTATSDTPVALTPGDEDAGSVSSAPNERVGFDRSNGHTRRAHTRGRWRRLRFERTDGHVHHPGRLDLGLGLATARDRVGVAGRPSLPRGRKTSNTTSRDEMVARRRLRPASS